MSIEDRCENWAAWVAGRSRWQRSAHSAEGMWRSPQCWEPLPPAQWRETDPFDGAVVESAVITLPLYHHTVLRGYYVRDLGPVMVLKRAAQASGQPMGKASGWGATLALAHAMLTEALELPSCIRKERARRIVFKVLDDHKD